MAPLSCQLSAGGAGGGEGKFSGGPYQFTSVGPTSTNSVKVKVLKLKSRYHYSSFVLFKTQHC